MSSANQNIPIKGLPIAILGIPVSNLTLSNIVSACLERIQKNKREGKLSYLSTIDGKLITKCYGWLPSTIDNPERLSIARNADISFLSGISLRMIGRLLGSTISPTYNADELLSSICQALGENEKGVFILGGVEKEAKNAAVSLHEKFHKLRLVGIATPHIFTEGEDLSNSNERDTLLIEQINSSNADVLLVHLGSLKQALWLERVRNHLSVPLVITIDHALIEIGKTQSAPPAWMENVGLSGLYKRWNTTKSKKSFTSINSVKLVWMALPLLIFHTLSRYLYKLTPNKTFTNALDSRLFLSAHRSVAILLLPECLNHSNFAILMKRFEDASSHDVLVFDFRNVRHIQPEGFYLLINTWLQRNRLHKEIYGFGPTTDIQNLMKLHRTWDLFKNNLCSSAEILMSRLKNQEWTTFYDTFTQGENLVIISVLGRLDNSIDYQSYMKKLLPIIGQKNCCFDLSYCTYIDNSGFAFLLTLRKHLLSQHNNLTLGSVSKQFRKQFHLSSIDSYFTFTNCSL